MQGALGRFEPDQMQAVNSILVLILIPVFEKFIYPSLRRLRIPNTPLQRMGAGKEATRNAKMGGEGSDVMGK